MRTILFLCLLICSSFVAAKHEFISGELLFSTPTNAGGKLSPDGQYFSYIRRESEGTFLELADLNGTTAYQVLKLPSNIALKSYSWLAVDVVQLNLSINGEPLTYLFSIEKITENGATRIDGKTKKLEKGYIVGVLEEQADTVLFLKYENNGRKVEQELYRITLDQLIADNFDDAELIEEATKGLLLYQYDSLTKRLLGIFYDEDEESISIRFKAFGAKNWTLAVSFDNGEFKLAPVGFIDDSHLAVLTNKETDKIALHSFDIATQELDTLLYKHEDYDLTDASISATGELESVEYIKNGLPKKLWLNTSSRKLSLRFEATFAGSVPRVIASHEASGRSVVFVAGPNEAGKYYLYSEQKDTLALLVANYPELDRYEYPEHQVFTVKTDDGAYLEAYLTVPKDYSLNTLIVMPHGGPIGVRDYNFFEPKVQYLANRGFTILRVNFRGSKGFGKSFQEQGVGEFGQQIEADISSAVAQVLAENNFDNVCAVGSSYGAYSSVTLAINHPDIYDCVVASFGIYDLPLLFNYSNYRSGEEFSKEVEKVVGKNTQSKKDVSPVYLADKLNVPTLLVAGRKDEISGFEQSNRMRFILEKLGKPVDSLFYDKAGHGHSNWYGDRHESAYLVDFIKQTLELPLPDPAQLSDSSKEAIAYDYTVLGDVFDTGSIAPKDASKAIQFYITASEYDAPRATFNSATYYQRGEQVEKDMNKALELYEKSAELGHKTAYSRLASLYIGDFYIPRNDDKALHYILKSIEGDEENFNTNKQQLAYFYCTASDAHRSIQKCEEEFRAQKELIESKSDKSNFYSKIRDAIVYGIFTPEERESFTAFAIEAFEINYPEFEFDLSEVGLYEYVESERYGWSGKYERLVGLGLSEVVSQFADKPIIVGVVFQPDHPGVPGSDKLTYAIVNWEKFNADGKLENYSRRGFLDNAKNDWHVRFVDEEYTEGDYYKVTVYDVAGAVKYQKVIN